MNRPDGRAGSARSRRNMPTRVWLAALLATAGASVVCLDGLAPPASAGLPQRATTGTDLGDGHRTVDVGGDLRLKLSAPPGAEEHWSTSAPAVAKVVRVDGGAVVTGLAEGVATIRIDTVTDQDAAHDEVIVSVSRAGFTPVPTAYLRERSVALPDADSLTADDPRRRLDAGTRLALLAVSRDYLRVEAVIDGAAEEFWVKTAAVRIPASGIRLQPQRLRMHRTTTAIVSAIVEPTMATDGVDWQTSDPRIASVSGQGVNVAIRGLRVGKTTVRAVVSGQEAVLPVRIIKARKKGRKSSTFNWTASPSDYQGAAERLKTGAALQERSDGYQVARLGLADPIPWSGWAACGVWDDRSKLVKSYYRWNAYPLAMVGNFAALRCGMTEKKGKTNAYGFRHIQEGHQYEWQTAAWAIGRQWRDVAGWTMKNTLGDADVVTRQPPYRFCYERQFALLAESDPDVEADRIRTKLYVGETGRRVMTFFYTRKIDDPYAGCVKRTTDPSNVLWDRGPVVRVQIN